VAAKVAERMEVEIVFTENHRSDKDCEGRLRGKTAREDCEERLRRVRWYDVKIWE